MYRRRRPHREKISFSFDSFLDVVTNVIGIIIRLILVTWVGARAYTSAMMLSQHKMEVETEIVSVEPLPAPKPEDDPASKEVAEARREIERVRAKLLKQLKDVELVNNKENQTLKDLTLVSNLQKDLDKEKKNVISQLDKKGQQVRLTALTLEEMKKKGEKLREEILAVEKLPTPTKSLYFRTPVSRPVRSDEVFFECRGGKVTYIDLPAFLQEIKDSFEDRREELSNQLRSQWEVKGHTSVIGAFRLEYLIERQRDFAATLSDKSGPARNTNFSFQLSGWVVEPITENRGETLEAAMRPGSQFRQIIDGLVAKESVVTLWVYPDSFALYRPLRDFMYERDIEVAARPLPPGGPIAASRHGTVSRGQ